MFLVDVIFLWDISIRLDAVGVTHCRGPCVPWYSLCLLSSGMDHGIGSGSLEGNAAWQAETRD